MKGGLRSKHCANNQKVKTEGVKWLKEQSKEFCETGIHELIRRWNIAIDKNGDYVGKLGCELQKTDRLHFDV